MTALRLGVTVEGKGIIPELSRPIRMHQAENHIVLFPAAEVGRGLAHDLEVALRQEHLDLGVLGQLLLEDLSPDLLDRAPRRNLRKPCQHAPLGIPELRPPILDEQGVEGGCETEGVHG